MDSHDYDQIRVSILRGIANKLRYRANYLFVFGRLPEDRDTAGTDKGTNTGTMVMTTLDMLLEQERKLGRSQVEHACKQYLKMRRHVDVVPTPRKKIPRGWVATAYAQQDGCCHRCHKHISMKEATGDHTLPLSQGGKHVRANIRVMCRECNSAKSDNDPVTESKKTGKTLLEVLGYERNEP